MCLADKSLDGWRETLSKDCPQKLLWRRCNHRLYVSSFSLQNNLGRLPAEPGLNQASWLQRLWLHSMIGCDCLSVRVLLQPDVCVLAFPWLWPALHSPPQDFVGNTPAHPRALSLAVVLGFLIILGIALFPGGSWLQRAEQGTWLSVQWLTSSRRAELSSLCSNRAVQRHWNLF